MENKIKAFRNEAFRVHESFLQDLWLQDTVINKIVFLLKSFYKMIFFLQVITCGFFIVWNNSIYGCIIIIAISGLYIGFLFPLFFLFFYFFLFEMLVFSITFYCLMRNEKIKNFIYREFGKDFIVWNLGNPGSSAGKRMLIVAGVLPLAYGVDWSITHKIMNPLIIADYNEASFAFNWDFGPSIANLSETIKVKQESAKYLQNLLSDTLSSRDSRQKFYQESLNRPLTLEELTLFSHDPAIQGLLLEIKMLTDEMNSLTTKLCLLEEHRPVLDIYTGKETFIASNVQNLLQNSWDFKGFEIKKI